MSDDDTASVATRIYLSSNTIRHGKTASILRELFGEGSVRYISMRDLVPRTERPKKKPGEHAPRNLRRDWKLPR